MRVIQRSWRRIRTGLLCRRVGDPRRAHYDETGNVLVREPEEAAGRALVSEGRHHRNLRRRILPGVLSRGGWSLVVATTGVNGLNFLFHVLISRLLGPSHYGALGAVLNVISVLAVPLGAGTDHRITLARFLHRPRLDQPWDPNTWPPGCPPWACG